MLKKNLVVLTMLTTFVSASEMELVLEVGRDNTQLSATSQAKIDTTESSTDKLINEFKVVSKKTKQHHAGIRYIISLSTCGFCVCPPAARAQTRATTDTARSELDGGV